MNDLRPRSEAAEHPHSDHRASQRGLDRRARSTAACGRATWRAARLRRAKADGILCLHREDKTHPTCDHEKRPPTPGLMQVYADKWRGVSGGTFYCELMELRSEHRFVSVGATDATPEVIDPRASMTRVRAPRPGDGGRRRARPLRRGRRAPHLTWAAPRCTRARAGISTSVLGQSGGGVRAKSTAPRSSPPLLRACAPQTPRPRPQSARGGRRPSADARALPGRWTPRRGRGRGP